jgi:hypothetical protein
MKRCVLHLHTCFFSGPYDFIKRMRAERNCPTSITHQNPAVFHQPRRFSCALPHLTLKFQSQVNTTLLLRSIRLRGTLFAYIE